MSLLEEWDIQESSVVPDYDLQGPNVGSGDLVEEQYGSSKVLQQPIFSVEVAERSIARGRGQVTGMAAANSFMAVVTSRGWLLRYDFSQGSSPVVELEISKAADTEAEGVWMDPTGMHHIVATKQRRGNETLFETHYFHSRWKKVRPLAKLKGSRVTSVAWNAAVCSESNSGEIALGTAAGTVLSLVCDEKDKKERAPTTVLDLSAAAEPIRGLLQLPLPTGGLLLLLTTATRLHAFKGHSGTLEALGTVYQGSAGTGNCVELPSSFASGALTCYSSPGGVRPKRFAWLSGPGLYKGGLDLNPRAPPASELDYLSEHNLLPLPLSPSLQEDPISVAQTEYHELVLYNSRLHVINRVSQTLVQELPLSTRNTGLAGAVNPLGFLEDASTGTLFIFTEDALMEVVLQNEDRDMWQVYLERKDFANSFRHCRTQAQRDEVNHAEATAAFEDGNFQAAARSWGRVTAAPPSFEEVALKFVETGQPDALQTFLLTKLDTLAPADKAQATMIATWLTELSLDRINRALLEEGGPAGEASRAEQLTQELRDFLQQHVEVLDVKTTITLLASYGRLEDLMHFATCRKDNEAVLEYLVQKGDARRALALLRRPDVSQELFYKFAPGLIPLAPGETVDAWMSASPPLLPKRLLPALLRYSEGNAPLEFRSHILRYIHFCMDRLQSEEPAVHQLAVALYCSQGDEDALLEYLQSARDILNRPLYDPQAALRLARQHNLARASVELLWQLGLYQEAVALALESDMDQAIRLVNRQQEDESLQRKLWLSIAHHLINSASDSPDGKPGESINKVNDLMREAGGLLKIEDILPLFPDFARIDTFKDAICHSLEDYNSQIAGLKTEMEDVTRIADALRKDMAKLEQRTATLSLAEPCASCSRPVGQDPPPHPWPPGAVPPYFLFPTGNAFHGTCLAREVLLLANPKQEARIRDLLAALSQENGRATANSAASSSQEEMKAKLHSELSIEDPYNGEMVVRGIQQPFYLPSETAEIESWSV